MDLVDAFLRKASLLRQSIVILLNPRVYNALLSQKAKSTMRRCGLSTKFVWFPTDLVLTRQRGLSNDRSRDASACVEHRFPRQAKQVGQLLALGVHDFPLILELRGSKPLRCGVILPRWFVALPQNLGAFHWANVCTPMHKEWVVMRHETRASQPVLDGIPRLLRDNAGLPSLLAAAARGPAAGDDTANPCQGWGTPTSAPLPWTARRAARSGRAGN
mmetsp:Transcript_82589/g.207830  ORF Transcript_82589/g.207830 Transcript_82589/m.207830 type:complete len:217 (-) Transcript_82589:206-856(-)